MEMTAVAAMAMTPSESSMSSSGTDEEGGGGGRGGGGGGGMEEGKMVGGWVGGCVWVYVYDVRVAGSIQLTLICVCVYTYLGGGIFGLGEVCRSGSADRSHSSHANPHPRPHPQLMRVPTSARSGSGTHTTTPKPPPSSLGSSDEEEAGGGEKDALAAPPRSSRSSRGHKQSFEVEIASLDPRVRARLTDMWALPNLALLLSYFAIGFAMTFTGTPLTAYVVTELNAPAAQLNIAGTMLALPWSFKVGLVGDVCVYDGGPKNDGHTIARAGGATRPRNLNTQNKINTHKTACHAHTNTQVLYGLLSDCVPIRGKRRKPYLIIGWSLFVFCNLFLCALGRPSLNALIALVRTYVCLFCTYDTHISPPAKQKAPPSKNKDQTRQN